MKAALYEKVGRIKLREVERNAPGPGYVLVDTRCAGICGSDLHNYFWHWEPPLDKALGHEVAGVVLEVGQGVEGFAPGDRVAVEGFAYDGDCAYCRQGHYNHCLSRGWFWGAGHGGFSQYSTMHVSTISRLPEHFSFEQGALVEPLAVAHRAVMQAGLAPGDRVLVIGGGSIGLLTLAAAIAAGARETAITAKYPQQIRIAEALGADYVVDAARIDVVDFVREWTNEGMVECVIETVGGAGNFNDSLKCVKKRGVVVLVAGYYEPLAVDIGNIVGREAIVRGSNCYAYSSGQKDVDTAIQLIAAGKVEPTKIVTHRLPLDDVEEAFRIAADKSSGAIKVHLVQT